MDRTEIVRTLTSRGVIVTPDILEIAERDGVDGVSAEGKAAPHPRAKTSISIRKAEPMERMSPEDFAYYYSNRYTGLRDILLKRMDAVSINKTKDISNSVSVIGMVRSRIPGGFCLEDSTGEVDVISGDVLKDDDVVGVKGVMKEGRLFQKELLWPDIEPPLTRQLPDISILLTTFLDSSLSGVLDRFSTVFVTEKTTPGADDPRVVKGMPNPCYASIKKDGRKLLVLIYRPPGRVTPEQATVYLKKRHLLPDRNQIRSREDPFLIDPVPDLFWVVSDQRHVGHYRGVTVVMSREHDAFGFDAGTGEVYFARGASGEPKPAG